MQRVAAVAGCRDCLELVAEGLDDDNKYTSHSLEGRDDGIRDDGILRTSCRLLPNGEPVYGLAWEINRRLPEREGESWTATRRLTRAGLAANLPYRRLGWWSIRAQGHLSDGLGASTPSTPLKYPLPATTQLTRCP